ncbi:MAG TPA: hypothetical protein VE075_09825, partial [Thermoanaerobaculia bacterium]|nr:hypothetical protein [Thermoanaerobaculia bacterium]
MRFFAICLLLMLPTAGLALAEPARGAAPPVGGRAPVSRPARHGFALKVAGKAAGTAPPPEVEITAGDTFQDLRTVVCDLGPSNATLSITVDPPLTGTISPSSVRTPEDVTITVPTTNRTPEGIYTVQVDIEPADSSSLCQAAVVPISFRLDAPVALAVTPPSQTLVIGQSASYNVDIFTKNFGGKVHLGTSGLPQGVTASFSPNDTSAAKSTLTLTAAASAAAQAATAFQVTGMANVQVDPGSASVTLAPPSVNVAVKPATQTVMAGAAGSFKLRYDKLGVGGPVTLAGINGAPANAVPAPGIGANQPPAIQLKTDPNTEPATYSLNFVFQFQANGQAMQT